jgi:hypothetical protein
MVRFIQYSENGCGDYTKETYQQPKVTVEERRGRMYNKTVGGICMESFIISREILPEPIISYIHSAKIKIFEENGNIILSPIKEKPNLDELFGMFSDGKLSTEKFIKQKAIEKEMEH